MDQFPFPETRSAWLAFVLLVITLFLVYYGDVYGFSYRYYNTQYAESSGKFTFPSRCLARKTPVEGKHAPNPSNLLSSFLSTIAIETQTAPLGGLVEIQDDCAEQKWGLILRFPRYTSYPAPGWIYFTLKNQGTVTQSAALAINLNAEELILLPSMYSDNIFIRAAELPKIAPGATYHGRLFFGANHIDDQEKCDKNIVVYINDNEVNMSKRNLTCPKNDTYKSLARSIVENILLPPWANTLIPILSLFLCFMFDKEDKDNDKPDRETNRETNRENKNIFLFLRDSGVTYAWSLLAFFVVGFVLILILSIFLENLVISINPGTFALIIVSLIFLVLVSFFTNKKEIWENRINILNSKIGKLFISIHKKLFKPRQ